MFKGRALVVLSALAAAVNLAFAQDDQQARKPKIFMIGDSTMANKSLKDGNTERGWGHVLGGFLTEDIEVENHAVNGRSSKSFIDEGRWDVVCNKLQPGDYVVIQFGHNDEKPKEDRHTDPGTTFDANLIKFVDESRAKGAKPILMNSIVRRNYSIKNNAVANDDYRKEKADEGVEVDTLVDTHGEYLNSPRNVARDRNVPFVDMNKITHKLVTSLGKEGSKKLFMWVEPGVQVACPKGRQDNTHLNIWGARQVASLAIDAMAEVCPELKPFVRHYDYVVAKDGSGDFFTFQEAVNAVPDYRKAQTTIYLRSGEYKEKVVIAESKKNIKVVGETGAVLAYDDWAQKKNQYGEEKGTSGSSSVYIYGDGFEAENVTFANTAGPVGQAVACYVGCDAKFKKCRFLGNQDTLYTNGNSPKKDNKQYYEECYIEGTVDFIFGSATCYFEKCHIHSLNNGYLTAPSTPEGQKYGYVFHDCRITAADGVDKVFLSRPWRPYAQCVYVECSMDGHITPEGWNNWGKASNEATAFYGEYKSTGAGAKMKKRAKWAKKIEDADKYSKKNVIGE